MKQPFILLFAIFMAFTGCQTGDEFKKNPVDVIIRDMPKGVESFSIILYDMDVEGTFVRDFKHQYKIVKVEKGEPKEEITDWYAVTKTFFRENENNMGMEIAARSKDGKLSKNAAPPGYSNYVGNTQYGQWVNDGSGHMMWNFFAQYAMMSMMFNMISYPAYRNNWSDYRSNYYGRSSYYGPTTSSGNTTFGTQSAFARKTNANSRWKNSFQSRSSSVSSSKSNRSSSFWGSSRSSRSGSRWGNSGGSFRSRSRGFGK